jgi:hypothetical protein
MDLTVNNRVIAVVDIRLVQLGRLLALGAFELIIRFPVPCTPRPIAFIVH